MTFQSKFSESRFAKIIFFTIIFVSLRIFIKHHFAEKLSEYDLLVNFLLITSLLVFGTIKANNNATGSYSLLSKTVRICLLALGMSLLFLKLYLATQSIVLHNTQFALIFGSIYGIISYLYFNIIETDLRKKKLVNFLKYTFAIIAAGFIISIFY